MIPPTMEDVRRIMADRNAALTRDLLEVSRLPVDDPRRAEWVARKDAALAEVES